MQDMTVRRSITTIAALAVAGLLGAVAYAGAQATGGSETTMMNDGGMGDMGMGMAGTRMGTFSEEQPFDAQFLDQMSVHHEGAIASTTAMILDSSRPELRGLAEDIVTGQRAELSQMRAWRVEWYPDLEATFDMAGSMANGSTDGRVPMMGGDDGGSMMSGAMMGSGATTERMYLTMMITHHQLAVDMAEQAQRDATHPELRALAATIADEQAAQIVEMRGYLANLP
ncbi:DUF305 domain-containing protein [soil metagenome]